MQFQGDYYIMIKPDGVARPFKVLCKMFNNSGKRLGIGYSFICLCVNCSFVVVLSLLLCFVLFYCSTVAVSDSVDEICYISFFFILNCLLFILLLFVVSTLVCFCAFLWQLTYEWILFVSCMLYVLERARTHARTHPPVSYTHLTLPTRR